MKYDVYDNFFDTFQDSIKDSPYIDGTHGYTLKYYRGDSHGGDEIFFSSAKEAWDDYKKEIKEQGLPDYAEMWETYRYFYIEDFGNDGCVKCEDEDYGETIILPCRKQHELIEEYSGEKPYIIDNIDEEIEKEIER